MANKNYNNAEEELHLANLKNIKIELKRGSNPQQCINIKICDLNGEQLEEDISTSTLYGRDSFLNLFKYLDKKYGIKKYFCEKPADITTFSKDLTKELAELLKDTTEKIYDYHAFWDKKGFVKPSFFAYYGLWGKNKEFLEKFSNYKIDENKNYILGEIGDILGITKESVRQHIEKILIYFKLCFLEKFEEYIYKINYILENEQNYIIPENLDYLEGYEKLLDEIFEDYGENINFYIDFSLGMIRKKGISDEALMNDDSLPYTFRKKIEEQLNKLSTYIYGEKIICKRQYLMQYCIKKNCQDAITLNDIQKLYRKMLVENNLGDKDDLIYDDRRLDNMMSKECHYALLSLGKQYRYYESEKMDEVVNALDLSVYKDVVISAKKIYNDNLDLMKKYDIRNIYELHNLLNKKIKDSYITFGRMPTIYFGKADRDSQMLELLKQLSPASAKDLAEAYSEKYGDAENTIMGSYLNSFAKYKVGEEYIYA